MQQGEPAEEQSGCYLPLNERNKIVRLSFAKVLRHFLKSGKDKR
jgi:hypothetical protein